MNLSYLGKEMDEKAKPLLESNFILEANITADRTAMQLLLGYHP